MLQNSIELLKSARKSGRCLAAFNIYNLETIAAAFSAAERTQAPVILAFGEGYLKYASFETIAAIVNSLDKYHQLPVVLHLDHCRSIENIRAAIAAGFTSVMYDGSALPFKENIVYTKLVAEYAHDLGVSVEGELGRMNSEDGRDDYSTHTGSDYTDPQQALEYFEQTRIDSLAVSVGNAHGLYKGVPNLVFSRISEIYEKTKLPLVLHGSSGIPDEQLVKAIGIAISKVNINTELAITGAFAIKELLSQEDSTPVRMEILMSQAKKQMDLVMEHYIRLTYRL